jgi:hypothetical protein
MIPGYIRIDRAHHHPHVFKSSGLWQVWCPRCGPFQWSAARTWRNAMVVALHHAKEAHS